MLYSFEPQHELRNWACIIVMALAIIRFWIRKTWRWGSYNMFSQLFYQFPYSWIFHLVWSQHKIKLSRGMQCCSTIIFNPVLCCDFRSSLEPCVSQASPKTWKPSQISIIYFLAFFFLEGGSTGSAAFPRFLELEPLGSSEGSVFGWLLVFAFGSGLLLALLAGLMFLSWNRLVEILVASWKQSEFVVAWNQWKHVTTLPK